MIEFSQRVLKRFEEVFMIQNRPVESFDMEEKYLKLLFLRDIYGFSDQETIDHVGESLRQQLDLQENLNKSTVWRKRDGLCENDTEGRVAIRKAAKRIVFECCAAGEEIPQRVLDEYDIPVSAVLSNEQIRRQDEHDALRKWVEWFFDAILQPLTYNREGATYLYRRYVGLCAHCALQTIAPNDAVNTADYLYDGENIPSGGSLTENIQRTLNHNVSEEDEDLGFPAELRVQFQDCYRRFFAEANRLGFFEESKPLVVDVTRLPTTGDKESSESVTGGSGSGRKPAKYGKHSWAYQFLSIPNSGAPFIRSIVPVHDGKPEHERLDEQLASVVDDPSLTVDVLLCDKGYYRTNIVDVCREHLQDSWIICAKFAGEIGQLVRNAPKGEIVWKRDVLFGDPPMQEKPGAVVYPNTKGEKRQQRDLSDFGDVTEESKPKRYLKTNPSRSHIAYLTDLRLESDRIRKIHVLYNKRPAVEPTIGQVRHTFLPHTESMNPAVRTYLINLAGLFYNLHHLIKRTLSPDHGVPLDPSGKELLTAIRDVAFT